MPPSPAPGSYSTPRLILILVIGYVIGVLGGAAIALKLPMRYSGTARLEGSEHAWHGKKISSTRAAMIVRIEDLAARWDLESEVAAEKVLKAVSLQPDDTGVEISASLDDPYDARMIATAVAHSLASPAREREIADRQPKVKPLAESEKGKDQDIRTIYALLDDQALEAGFSSIDELPGAIAAGNEKALQLSETEDYKRRMEGIDRLAREIGFLDPAGEPFRFANFAATIGPMPKAPDGPSPKLWTRGGSLVGLLWAGLLILCLRSWKPELIRKKTAGVQEPIPRDAADSPENW